MAKYNPCSKCGAINEGASKHRPFFADGREWCGHCGTRLTLYKQPPSHKPIICEIRVVKTS